jgi:hypothetical protein
MRDRPRSRGRGGAEERARPLTAGCRPSVCARTCPDPAEESRRRAWRTRPGGEPRAGECQEYLRLRHRARISRAKARSPAGSRHRQSREPDGPRRNEPAGRRPQRCSTPNIWRASRRTITIWRGSSRRFAARPGNNSPRSHSCHWTAELRAAACVTNAAGTGARNIDAAKIRLRLFGWTSQWGNGAASSATMQQERSGHARASVVGE